MATDPLDVQDLVRAAADSPWQGMPAGTVIGHVHLHVGDIDRAARLYHEGIGFDKVVWSYPGALFLSAGGYHHHLGNNTWASQPHPAAESDARLLEWTIIVPASSDVDGVAKSLADAGLSTEREGQDVIAADEWGTRVRITAENRA
jgi:catechol 2,3-dioxygenase